MVPDTEEWRKPRPGSYEQDSAADRNYDERNRSRERSHLCCAFDLNKQNKEHYSTINEQTMRTTYNSIKTASLTIRRTPEQKHQYRNTRTETTV
jgi:hypothetical protein